MSTPQPPPGGDRAEDPAMITAEVEASLRAIDEGDDVTTQARALEALHQRLAAALATIDGV